MRKLLIAIIACSYTSLAIPQTHSYTFYPKDQYECLAKNIYFESRGEPLEGQILVARVTLNRAKTHDNICRVVYEKKQFSWTSTGLRKKRLSAESLHGLATSAYQAQHYPSNAEYFHAEYVKPKWAKSKILVAKVGKHIFYV